MAMRFYTLTLLLETLRLKVSEDALNHNHYFVTHALLAAGLQSTDGEKIDNVRVQL